MSCKCPRQPASLAEDNFLPLILSCHVCSKNFSPNLSIRGRGKGRFRERVRKSTTKRKRPRSAITHSHDHTPSWLRGRLSFLEVMAANSEMSLRLRGAISILQKH
ncbi:hypothetical protein CDAR_454711 [Caerostris darwini]|uniref:Uncharacterized protein n=1 Tax=Caerostris darwini TaxID=1538125 RepID=A0AAV4TXV0_9ARAC|nr:hypothetical protein CDAR_454711 [Caerostris darwini]